MSLILTLLPLYCVLTHTFTTTGLVVLVIAMAVVQMCIQLFFFMHGTEKPNDGLAWHLVDSRARDRIYDRGGVDLDHVL
jgi:heme/copper-type cytochrome/quinol oxidase subunit 4